VSRVACRNWCQVTASWRRTCSHLSRDTRLRVLSIFHPLRTCVVKEHVWSLQQRLSLHCDRQICVVKEHVWSLQQRLSLHCDRQTCVVKERVWSLQQHLSLHCDRQIVHKAQQHFEVIINCYLLLSKEEVNVFARVRLSVCLSVSKITEKCMHGFGWIVAKAI